jgi:hypothetical protein
MNRARKLASAIILPNTVHFEAGDGSPTLSRARRAPFRSNETLPANVDERSRTSRVSIKMCPAKYKNAGHETDFCGLSVAYQNGP